MPFTISHVAAALPGRRVLGLPLAGLAAGAMSPDLEYLFQLGTSRTISHTVPGVLVLDLPMALLALGVASLAAPGLATLVPGRWPEIGRWLGSWQPPWSTPGDMARLVVAIIVGALNHIAVDEFTHGGGRGVEWLPALETVVAFGGRSLTIYRSLQYGLSVVGLVALAVLALRWLRALEARRPRAPQLGCRSGPAGLWRELWAERHRLLAVAALAMTVVVAAIVQTTAVLPSPGLNKATAVMLVVGAWRAGMLALVGVGAFRRGLDLLGIDSRRAP